MKNEVPTYPSRQALMSFKVFPDSPFLLHPYRLVEELSSTLPKTIINSLSKFVIHKIKTNGTKLNNLQYILVGFIIHITNLLLYCKFFPND